jgi:hypothetical protein
MIDQKIHNALGISDERMQELHIIGESIYKRQDTGVSDDLTAITNLFEQHEMTLSEAAIVLFEYGCNIGMESNRQRQASRMLVLDMIKDMFGMEHDNG